MRTSLTKAALGFVAAALSVVLVHQTIILIQTMIGLTDRVPWSLAPVPPWGVPALLNAIFWGGLWGSVLAFFYGRLPGSSAAVKGLVFGWLMFIFSNSIVVPLLKGQPLFFGLDLQRMLSVFIILSGFGAATACIYKWLRERAGSGGA